MKTFQIVSLLSLFASAMAFVPSQVPKGASFIYEKKKHPYFYDMIFLVNEKKEVLKTHLKLRLLTLNLKLDITIFWFYLATENSQ